MDPTEPPAEGMTRRRRARIGAVAVLALIVALLLVFSSRTVTDIRRTSVVTGSPTATNMSGIADASPTVGDAPTPGASDSGTPTPTPVPTHVVPPTPTLPPTPTATPMPPSVHEVAQTTTLFGGDTGPATSTCPQGELALAGGWSEPPQYAHVFSASLNGNTWAVSVLPLGHTASTTVTAYVECLRGAAGAVVTPRPQQLFLPAGSFNGDTVGCTLSEHLVGWGFTFGSSSAIELTATHPEILGWTLEFLNHGGVDQSGTLVAECLSNMNVGANRINSSGVSVPVGATGANQVSCPLGTAAVGGFQYSSAGGGNLYLLHATSTGWQAAAYAATTSIFFNVWAMCLYFS